MSRYLPISNTTSLPSKLFLGALSTDDKTFLYEEYIGFDIGLVTALYICLGIFIIVNKCRFSHVALVNIPSYPLTLKFKILLITFTITLFIISFALSFLDQAYWVYEYNKLFGLFYIIPIIVLVLQIHWLRYQFERKIPLSWHQNQLFWSALSISYCFVLVICYLANTKHKRYDSPDFIISLLKTLNSMTLMVFTFRKPQDMVDYMTDSQGIRIKLLSEKGFTAQSQNISLQNPIKKRKVNKSSANRRKSDTTKLSNADEEVNLPISVIVASKVQHRIDPKTSFMEKLYKVHIKTGPCDYKVERTMNDFKRLENTLLTQESFTATQSFIGQPLNVMFSDYETEDISNVASIITALQGFVNNILKADKISNTFMDFLEIPESERYQLREWYRQQSPNEKDKNSVLELPSVDGQDDSPNRRAESSSMEEVQEEDEDEEEKKDYIEITGSDVHSNNANRDETLHLTKFSEKDYCPYFTVNIINYKKPPHKDYIEYRIKLELMEKPDESWEILKRYSDFVHVHKHLRKAVKVIPPKLPTKFILTDEELEDRKKGLESWLRIVLNEKIYFTKELFEFIELNTSYYDWLKDEDALDFSNFEAKIDNNQILMSNNKPYTVYHIAIINSPLDLRKKKQKYSLYRRFKEFDQLHQSLLKRFASSQVDLPNLPPKYTTFSNKTTVDSRQQGLQTYLNELFHVPNIGDSFAFRKFVSYKRPMDSFITGKETSDQMLNSSCEPEIQNISNIAIEKSLSTARGKKDHSIIKLT